MNDIQSNAKIDQITTDTTEVNTTETNTIEVNTVEVNTIETTLPENNITETTTEVNVAEPNVIEEVTLAPAETTPVITTATAPITAATIAPKSTVADLQKIVQKLEKLEKMINPNSKKSLILWEEDNSFKNLIASIVSYATTCDTAEFPIELLDRLKALNTDVNNQIAEGSIKIEELNKQAKINTDLSEVLSTVYISAMAGNPIEEYEDKIQNEELLPYREQLITISTAVPETEEYIKAEKAIKSKITNLENSVHITIDLERTTSKGGALEYIKTEISPALARLQVAYDEQYKVNEATQIDGEEAMMALAVRKTFSEKVYDTIVRPFANFFKRRSKVK